VPEDYVFEEAGADGAAVEVRLSKLFAPGKDSLVLYSYMFPRHPLDDRPGPEGGESARLALQESPCPSCTALIDQLEGAAEHAGQHVNLAIVARADLAPARVRRRARLAAAATAVGGRQLLLSRLSRSVGRRNVAADAQRLSARRRHDPSFLGLGAVLRANRARPGSARRGPIETLWNLFDFTPEGRPDFDEQLSYCCHPRAA
jgi:predicted dithiol-disulfide oxidoreductase (DUF899 family)